MGTCAESGPAATAISDCARLCVEVPLPAIQAEVASLTHRPWVKHVNQQDYSGDWDSLPLRCQSRYLDAHPILQSFAIEAGGEWRDLPVLEALPALSGWLRNLPCPLQAVRLMRLRAGADIKPHRDHGLSIEHGEARLHLPIYTCDQIAFSVNQQVVPMRAGELWYVNVDQTHAVQNRGTQDRINLVIDCLVNDWLLGVIRSGICR